MVPSPRDALLFMSLLLSGGAARGATLAVMPLQAAPSSEVHPGLGLALTGMLTTDLSRVEGITLVERAQLDQVLGELSLSDTAFIDPQSAVRLGRGVAAQTVLLGEWAVEGEQLTLSARLVEVEGGRVLDGAVAQGPTRDFVAVEKALVEQLLGGMALQLSSGDRRRLLMEAPTEEFGALTAWGAGLERERAGDLEGAREAYARALAQDPRFEEASAALSALRASLEAAIAAREGQAQGALDQAYAQLLSETSSALPAADDPEGVAAFALRLAALQGLGRDCERLELMERYLAEVPVAPPPLDKDGQVLSVRLFREDQARRLSALHQQQHGGAHAAPSLQVAGLWADPASFVLGGDAVRPQAAWEGAGVVGSLERCLPVSERVAAYDHLLSLIPTDLPPKRRRLSLKEWVVILRAYAAAQDPRSPSDDLLSALLDARPPEDPMRQALESEITQVIRLAARHALWLRLRGGRDEAEFTALVEGILAHPDQTLTQSPRCQALADLVTLSLRTGFAHQADQAARGAPAASELLAALGPAVSTLGDVGCLAGEPARLRGRDEIAAFTREGLRQVRADAPPFCVGYAANVQNLLSGPQLPPGEAPMEAAYAFQLLMSWYGGVVAGDCLER
ncbi:MAG: hypothetical protein JXX28_00730 [Deltaproteobacteria bacterium]|nr:hypothetical protein [Deltaproteobacteria bacterium]